MRRATLILSLTTVAFAATTAYLAAELYGRAETTTVAAEAPVGPGGARSASHSPGAPSAPGRTDKAFAPATAAAPAPSAAAPGGASKAAADTNANMFYARQQLASLADPARRATLLDQARLDLRRQFAALRERLKLSDATFDQLVTLMAEQNLQAEEAYLRCAVDPKCNVQDNSRRAPVDDRSGELLALLGSDNFDEFTRYRSTVGERDAIVQLRGRLTDANLLGDSQAESLAVALANERELYQKEVTARGSSTSGWGTSLGMVMYSNDSNSIDQRLAEAAQYSQRLRQRAATVLSPAQLAAYIQMQDELLAQMAAFMRPSSSSRG